LMTQILYLWMQVCNTDVLKISYKYICVASLLWWDRICLKFYGTMFTKERLHNLEDCDVFLVNAMISETLGDNCVYINYQLTSN